MSMKFTNRQGALRFYDSTATPYYLELNFDTGDMNAPVGAPKQDEILVLHRGTMDANAHYIKGPDDKLMEIVPITFSIVIEDTTITTYVLDWIDGGTVNSNTVVTTKGDTQRDGANYNPAFADANKKCIDISLLWTTLGAGSNLGYRYYEVFFPSETTTWSEAEEGVNLSFNGECYGTISRITSFGAGNDVTV